MAEHDALFKRIFSVPENAAGELRTMLPPALVARLDLHRLELMDGSFVSRELRFRQTDLLFRVPLRRPRKGRTHVYIYVLMEHQSKADPQMAYRMLEYLVRIWAKLRADHPGQKTLPLIIPLVVHHGARAWSTPRRLHQLVEGLADNPELGRFVPNFELLIDDLAMATNADLMARPLAPVAQVAAWLLRDGRDVAQILAHLEVWASRFAEVLARHPDESEAFLRYILLSAGEDSLDEVRKTILLYIPAAEAPMASAGEQLIQQGFQRGMQHGRLATLRETLTVQLDARFGAPGPSVTAVIEAAPEPALQRMLLRVTTATTVEDVLAAS